jgi:hypothetical protein
MQRHLSTGVSTIVALMAAHRATSCREGAPAVYCQEEVARIDAYLREEESAEQVTAERDCALTVGR